MGRQMVETFLLEEVNVSYCARTVTDSDFADFHKSLPASNTARAVGTSVDVSSKDALYDWIKNSGDKFGRIDTVIANGKMPLHLSHPRNGFIDR
jgi:3-oxoacyl-[acyl-carrier protein] reductase